MAMSGEHTVFTRRVNAFFSPEEDGLYLFQAQRDGVVASIGTNAAGALDLVIQILRLLHQNTVPGPSPGRGVRPDLAVVPCDRIDFVGGLEDGTGALVFSMGAAEVALRCEVSQLRKIIRSLAEHIPVLEALAKPPPAVPDA